MWAACRLCALLSIPVAALVCGSPQAVAQAVPRLALVAPVTNLYLEVVVNGVPTRRILPVRQTQDRRLLMAPEHVQLAGLLPLAVAAREDGWIDLAQLPGVWPRYVQDTQTLHLHAEDAAMAVRVFDVQVLQRVAQDTPVQTPQDFGVFVNHLFSWDSSTGGGQRRTCSLSGLLEGHVYGRLGAFSSTHQLHGTQDIQGQRHYRAVRLDTRWSWFNPEHMLSLNAGDFIISSLSWGRSVRLAGIQIRRNFAVRPDLITTPMLSGLTGSAAVPSTVEVYVNNARLFSQDVATGPFAIHNLPLVSGGGTARLVVRDTLGRETISETPFYATSNLLAKGFSDFALEAGMARRYYGTQSNDYDRRFLTAATLRYGVSDATTLEGQVQFGGRLAQAGAGGVFRLGSLGAAAVAGAASNYDAKSGRETGVQWASNLEWEWRGVKLFARSQHTFGTFNDLASVTLSPRASTEDRRRAAPARSMQQVSLSYAGLPGLQLTYTPMRLHTGQRSRLLGLYTSYRLHRSVHLSVTTMRDLSRPRSLSVFAGFSWLLDNHVMASSHTSYRQGARTLHTAELARPEQHLHDTVGWRVRGAQGAQRMVGAQASYRSRIGRVQADVERMDARVNSRLQVEGALVFAGGAAFLANPIHDAFAVVDVGVPGVPVQYENNPVGKTGSDGKLLLSGLRAWERNLITIDPMRLPADTRIPTTRRVVSPQYRSGVTVRFGVVAQPRVALLTLHDETGAPIPVGTGAHLNDGALVVVGHGGEIWLEDIAVENRLVVRPKGQDDCVVQFSAPQTMTERLVIPNATCKRAL